MTTVAGIELPTHFRHLTSNEWAIVTRVFGDTLPYHIRVFIADGLGLYGAPFTVPTSIISSALVAAGIANPFVSLAGVGGLLTAPLRVAAGAGVGYGLSVVNAGYVINVGTRLRPEYGGGISYPDLTKTDRLQDLLVHEMTHVWQGKNSVFALSATLGSLAAQCTGMAASGTVAGRGAAYAVTLTSPLAAWGSFNPEQQAWIVEKWFSKQTGGKKEDEKAPEFDYIKKYVRQGKTS